MNPLEKKPEIQSPTPAKKLKFKFSFTNIQSAFKNIFISTQNIIGIDIGSSSIKIVQLQRERRGYLMNNCVVRPIPQVIRDNPVEKRKATQGFIKEFVAESSVKTSLARAVISGKGIYIFSLNIPALNKKDLKGAVAIELKKRLPFQLEIGNVYFDFFVTDHTRDEKGGAGLQITCIAVEKMVIEEELRFLKEINIRPLGINVISDALGNIIVPYMNLPVTQTVAIMDMGASITMLNFYKGRKLIFSREIPIGGEHLARAMVKTINTPSGAVNITAEDAEKIKRNCGIPLEDEAKKVFSTDLGILLGEQISTMLRPTLERLVLEINRTISYYTKTFTSAGFEELYLTGGASHLRNIDKFLLSNLEGLRKVEFLNAFKAVKGLADRGVFKKEFVMEQAAPHLNVAFAASLGRGGVINFLPMQERIEQATIFAGNLLRIIFPIFLGLSLALYGVIYANAIKYRILISNINLGISRLEPTMLQVKEYMSMKSKLDQRKNLLEKVKGKQPLWWGMMKDISNITPKDVILQKINIVQDKGVRQLHLTGKIFTKYTALDVAVSQYLMALGESPYFSNVELVSSKTDMYSPIPAANFEIVCQLAY